MNLSPTACSINPITRSIVDQEGREILSRLQLNKYTKYGDYLLATAFNNTLSFLGWGINDLSKSIKQAELYTEMKRTFVNDFEDRQSNLSDSTIEDLEKVMANWDIFSDYHRKYSGLLSISAEQEEGDEEFSEDDDFESTDEETQAFLENLDRTGNNKSAFELATSDIRTLFRMFPKKEFNPATGENIEVVGSDGLPIMADSGNMFTLFANELAGIIDEGEFEDKLLSNRVRRQFPEVVTLQQLIGLGTVNKSQSQLLTFNKFYNLFTRPRVQLWLGQLKQENGAKTFSFYEAVKNSLTKIEERLRANFLNQDIPESLLKSHTEIDRSYNPENGEQIGYGRLKLISVPELESVDFEGIEFKDLNVVIKSQLDFLQLIGIKFTGLNLLEPTEKENYARDIYRVAGALRKSIGARLEAGQSIYDPISDLKRPYKNVRSDAKYVREIMQLESLYSKEVPSLSMRTAKGEKQYAISDHNHVTLSLAYLNKARNIKELSTFPPFTNLKYNPLFQSTYLRNFLFDKNGNKIANREITVNNYNGFQQHITGVDRNNVTRDLSQRDKFVFDFLSFTKSKVLEVMRTEAKSTFLFLSLLNNDSPVAYTPYDNFFTDFKSGKFGDRMLAYLDGEVERIKSFEKKKQQNPNLPLTYGDFSIFSFLSPDLKRQILSGEYQREDFLNEVDKYFDTKLGEIGNFVRQERIDTDELYQRDTLEDSFYEGGVMSDRAKAGLMRAFIANFFINSIETSVFVTGDPLFAIDDFHKRLGGVISSGTLVNTTSEYKTYKDNNPYEQSFTAKYSLASTMGVKQRDNTDDFLSAVVPDVENSNNAYSRYDDVISGLKASFAKRGEIELTDDDLRDLIGIRVDEKGKVSGSEVKVTDGAAYMTLDFHRELAHKIGYWTPEAEIAYMYEGLIFKEDNGKLTSNEQEELEHLRAKIYNDPKKYGIPVVKFTFLGPIKNTTVDGKRFDKFAIQPIIPSFAINHPELDKINKDMIKSQLAYITHKSGTKLMVREITTDLSNVSPDILSSHLLKEQIDTSPETGEETTLLTQFVSLLFTNMFNNGVAVNEKVQGLFDRYKKIFKDLHEEQKKAVASIGIKLYENNEPVGFEPKKLVRKIQEQIGKQGYNSNVVNAISLDEEGNLKYPIEMSGIVGQVQDYVLGFLDKTLRRYKIQGTDHVVVSPAYTSRPLKYMRYSDSGIEKMEARVTFNNSHLPLLDLRDPKDPSKNIGTVKRLNQLLNDDGFVEKYEKFLTITFGRAPIDSPHSMGVAIIKQFFEPTAGSILQLPIEFIKQSGIDFDIDKEKVYFPYIIDTQEDVAKQIIELEAEYRELREYADNYRDDENDENVDKFLAAVFDTRMSLNPDNSVYDADNELSDKYRRYYSLKKLQSQLKVNELLSLFEEVLRLPESYADQVIPNSADKVNGIAERNGQEVGTTNVIPKLSEVFDYKQNLNVFNMFMRAKELLGWFAKGNTQNEFLKQGGALINQAYAYKKDKEGNPTTPTQIIQPTLLTPAEAKEIFVDGKIRMGGKYNVKNDIRQYFQAQKITSTVDSAKDPRFADLNLNKRNTGVAEFLDSMGVPFERVIDFINIPAIRQYVKLREKGGRGNKSTSIQTVLLSMGVYDKSSTVLTESDTKTFQAYQRQGLIAGKPSYDSKTKVWKYDLITLKGADPKILRDINLLGFSEHADLENLEFNTEFNDKRVNDLKRSTDYKLGGKDFKDTLHLLSYFTALENHQWKFSLLKNLMGNITSKVGNTIEINNERNRVVELLKDGFVTQTDMESMVSKALPNVFNHNDFIEKTLNLIFPVISEPIITRNFSNIYNSFVMQGGASAENKRSLPRLILNDFIYSLLTNFGKYNGENFIDYGVKLIAKNNVNSPLIDSLAALKKRPYWDKLTTDYPVLSRFNPNIASKINSLYTMKDKDGNILKSIPYNIEFIDNFDSTQSQVEDYIEQISALISDDFYFEGDPTRSREDNEKLSKYITKFTKDLLVASLTQAGISKSRLSYYQLIPPAFTQTILQPAFSDFLKLPDEQKAEYMWRFGGAHNVRSEIITSFRYNNPKFFAGSIEETWRGKNYRFDIDLGNTQEKKITLEQFKNAIQNAVRDTSGVEDFELGQNETIAPPGKPPINPEKTCE